ncbi:MAG: glutamate--tRNA ligase [Anaerolineae bacterium]|nr:glutamate--tRNA ligase [Anaerolineae bacterium]
MTDARPVRVRFAPSPTGPLHIGGVRTALFNWLFARHHQGKFILRLEDTDQKRTVPGSAEQLMGALRWFGLDYDEGPDIGGPYGPYVQSQRVDLYQQWAQWLVEHDYAYPCYCTPERLKQVNEEKEKRGEQSGYDRHCRNLTAEQRAAREAEGITPVVRFKMPLEGETVVHDLIRGQVTFENALQQDAVLLKSDGFPTYALAHVVDDHFMVISHVMRSNEWLPSLPLHWQLWDAVGWERPQFAHLPVLLNPNGKGKLSKRHAGFTQDGKQVLVLAKEFMDAGYLPEAVVNFLTNIGWSIGDDSEFFPVSKTIELFDLARVNPADSVYPIEKLDWLNGMWIRSLENDDLARRLRPVLEAAGLEVNTDVLLKVTPLVQTRIKTLNDIVDMAGFFFREEFQPAASPDEVIQKKMDAESTRDALELAYDHLAVVSTWTHENLEAAMRALAEELGLKVGQLFGSLRVAVTGQQVSPPLFETMEIIGREESLRRVKLAADQVAAVE